MKYAPTSNLTMTTPYSPEVVFVPLYPLGKGPATKSDEFLEKCQKGGGHFQSKKLYFSFSSVFFVYFLVFWEEPAI